MGIAWCSAYTGITQGSAHTGVALRLAHMGITQGSAHMGITQGSHTWASLRAQQTWGLLGAQHTRVSLRAQHTWVLLGEGWTLWGWPEHGDGGRRSGPGRVIPEAAHVPVREEDWAVTACLLLPRPGPGCLAMGGHLLCWPRGEAGMDIKVRMPQT